jgi:SAM-dependent methyltransferase
MMNDVDDYPGRSGYRNKEKAKRYADRSSARSAAEARMLRKLIEPLLDPGGKMLALDIPAGEGRAARLLRSLGMDAVEADISQSMLAVGQERGSPRDRSVVADIEGWLPFSEGTFDLVLCWRLLHHLPEKDRLTGVLMELARITRKWVVVSFFHPWSLHHLQRSLSTLLLHRKSCRFSFTLKQVHEAGEVAGLKLWNKTAQLPYLRDLWAAVFLKEVKTS